MNRLDETISNVAYILDVLIAHRRIIESGNCNNCKAKCGNYMPDPGEQVRYNCPFYERRNEDERNN